jgi:hypothetical protein
MKSLYILLLPMLSMVTYAQDTKIKADKIPFSLTNSGHIIMKVQVNGVEGTFIFDTGAGLNMMTKKFADKIQGLVKSNSFFTGHRATGEALSVDLWQAQNVEIEKQLKLTDEVFAVLDVDFPIDGLISLMPFRNKPFTIDFKEKAIILESNKSIKQLLKQTKPIPIQRADYHGRALDIFMNVRINDRLTLQAKLDSGAGFNTYKFNIRYLNQLDIDATKVKGVYKMSDFNPAIGNTYYHTSLTRLSTSNTEAMVNNPKVSFVEGLIYEGIIGLNWIGDRITIDLENDRILVP